jgi:hypothetical protein
VGYLVSVLTFSSVIATQWLSQTTFDDCMCSNKTLFTETGWESSGLNSDHGQSSQKRNEFSSVRGHKDRAAITLALLAGELLCKRKVAFSILF